VASLVDGDTAGVGVDGDEEEEEVDGDGSGEEAVVVVVLVADEGEATGGKTSAPGAARSESVVIAATACGSPEIIIL